jgi:hypothetical protein
VGNIKKCVSLLHHKNQYSIKIVLVNGPRGLLLIKHFGVLVEAIPSKLVLDTESNV